MKTKNTKKIIIALLAVAIFIVGWLAFCGYQWSWGPFENLHDIKTSHFAGNSVEYSMDNVEKVANSPLENKTIAFLGSSVTYGSASMGVSVADYIGARNNAAIIKEAVSGTTLVDEGIDSYISRIDNIDSDKVDLFVCQLSTNDATQKKELGKISSSKNINDFDTHTIAGAIEYIICYAQQKWDCPVVFFINPKYESENYQKMVDLMPQMIDKWGISVVDMWNNEEFNKALDENRELYMADKIHPTQAGYSQLWAPCFEQVLFEVID